MYAEDGEERTMTVEPEVVFNMDLANGPTSVRYCIMAADILDARDTLPPDLPRTWNG